MSYILDTYTKEPADFQSNLRRHFATIVRKGNKTALSQISPIQNIALVGALYKKNSPTGLSFNDSQHLQYALTTLGTYGIPVTNDFSVAVRNLAYNDNVLATPRLNNQKVDLWVQCFVFNPDNPKKKTEIAKDTSLYCQVAKEHFEPNIWAISADQSGADIIIAYANGPHEIGPAHFDSPAFMRTDNLDPLLYDASGILFRRSCAKEILKKNKQKTVLTIELDRVI